MKRASGFTLIELMISVAIVAIVVAIALPNYKEYVLRSHRADAQAALLDMAARQERFLAQNNSYTTLIAPANGLNMGTTTSAEGYYNLSVGVCAGGNISTCYVLTASATGSQAADTDCKDITFDSIGNRGPTTADCW
jgi:type IV pilus assembly protein PilE